MRKCYATMLMALCLSGCVSTVPKGALDLPPQSLADRQVQTRRFETSNHQAMLSAAAATLQDLGFTLDESEYTLGVLVASKRRDATSGGQVALAFLAALNGQRADFDKEQIIRVSMVMRDLDSSDARASSEPSALTPAAIAQIKLDVTKAVSEGLRKSYPAEISGRIATKIAQNTAQALTDDLKKFASAQKESGQSTVRVTFQRLIYNTAGQMTFAEQINDAGIYTQFFEKL
ncbi:MAG: hypothetical protein RRY29_11155, partial [Desulfovibrionaceae bacterium]